MVGICVPHLGDHCLGAEADRRSERSIQVMGGGERRGLTDSSMVGGQAYIPC